MILFLVGITACDEPWGESATHTSPPRDRSRGGEGGVVNFSAVECGVLAETLSRDAFPTPFLPRVNGMNKVRSPMACG